MTYNQVGLTAAEIAELKLSIKLEGWKITFLKPITNAYSPAPFLTKVEYSYDDGGHYPVPSTVSEGYRKVLYDAKNNRSFILHNIANTAALGTKSIVSIINHDLAETATDYIETINRTNCSGWPVVDTPAIADIAYNEKAQRLYLSVAGTQTPPARQAAIYEINVDKYLGEADLCDTLNPNPDYLNCAVTYPGYAYVGNGGSFTLLRQVDENLYAWYESLYYGHKIASGGSIFNTSAGGAFVRQLWKMNTAKTWTLVFQSHAFNRTVYTFFDTSVAFPAWPNINFIVAGTAVGNVSLNNSIFVFDHITDMSINGDILTMCYSPCYESDISSRAWFDWGWEMGVIQIDLTLLSAAEFTDYDDTGYSLGSRSLSSTVLDPRWEGGATNMWVQDVPEINTDYVLAPMTPFKGLVEIIGEYELTSDPHAVGGLGFSNFRIQLSDGGTIPLCGAASPSPYRTRTLCYCNGDGDIHVKCFRAALAPIVPDNLAWEPTGIWNNGDPGDPPPESYWWVAGGRYTNFWARKWSAGLLGIQDAASAQHTQDPSDPYGLPTIETDGGSPAVDCAKKLSNAAGGDSPVYTTSGINAGIAGCDGTVSVIPVQSVVASSTLPPPYISKTARGLWRITRDGSTAIAKATTADGLFNNYIPCLVQFNDNLAGILCTTPTTYASQYQLHWIYLDDFSIGVTLAFTDTPGAHLYPRAFASLDAIPGVLVVTDDRIRIVYDLETNPVNWRSLRVWWNGDTPDVDSLDGDIPIESPSFSESKGQVSYQLSFTVPGVDALPWAESAMNMDVDTLDSFSALLQHGTRVNVYRWVQAVSGWTPGRWVQECQVVITQPDINIEKSFPSTSIQCTGLIGLLVSRAVYEYSHEPAITVVTGQALTTADDLIYWYESGGEQVHDWLADPTPAIFLDGVGYAGGQIVLSEGTFESAAALTGVAVTASFMYYTPDTNRAEDIILCILRHPNKVGGPGLDDSYFTRSMTGEALTSPDDLVFTFPKNNLLADTVTIYRDGVDCTIDVTLDLSRGTATFGAPETGNVITGDADYYTIQRSGVSLPPVAYSIDTHKSALECIMDVCKHVSPNYIFHECRDGKFECDFFTQAVEGDEDVVVERTDIVVKKLVEQPGYDALATRVISIGQANLAELENLCFGKVVTDLLSVIGDTWTDGVVANVVDGDPYTRVGWGRGRDDSPGSWDIQAAVLAAAPDGYPMFSIDLGEKKKVKTILVARGPGSQANEGQNGHAWFMYSVWISDDNVTWKKIIMQHSLGPGLNEMFKAGTNFPETTHFQYLRLNIHSLGMYEYGKRKRADSQSDIAEVQCFESEYIKGVAELQDTDPAAILYDSWGLLKKYDFITTLARQGEPDPALNTQAKVDLDARYTLEEIIRLVTSATIDAIYLPGIPAFSTIRVRNSVTGQDETFYIETRSFTKDGYSFGGSTLP